MVGFELTINEKKISATLVKGIVSIILTKVTNETTDSIDLNFGGLDLTKDENIQWYDNKLNVGDEILIKVKEIDVNTKPIEAKKKNIEEVNKEKIKTYNRLKKELEEEGLL